MAKILIQIVKFILLIAAALSLFSCKKGIQGNGIVSTKELKVSESFEAIEVSDALTVVLKQGPLSLRVEADENLIDHIIVKIHDGTLKIYSTSTIKKATSKTVFVSAPIIKQIKTTAASDVNSSTYIKANMLKLNASSASSINLKIVAKDLICNASSASHITVEGKNSMVEAKSTSASTIDLENLESENAIVESSSASNIIINAKEKLVASASSASDVLYVGRPKQTQFKKSSAANINQK